MLNKTLERLGWQAVPFCNKKSTFWKKGIMRTRTRRQDLSAKIVLHHIQGDLGGKQGLINFATKVTKSPVCLWWASPITTSCTWKRINKWDAERVPGSEGSRRGFSAKIITFPIWAPSWALKGAGRDKLGRRRRSKITKKLLETNHSGEIVLQVEIAGYARDAKNYTDREYVELGELVADMSEAIAEETGKPFRPKALETVRVDDPMSRSKKAACRADWIKWETGDWDLATHSQVPNNDHGDSNFDLVRICDLANIELGKRKGAPEPFVAKGAPKPAKAAKKPQKAAGGDTVDSLLAETATYTGKVQANLVKLKKQIGE